MSLTFFKWIQYLERKEVSKFIGLYNNNCILVPKIEGEEEKKSLINPYTSSQVLHNRVGVFKNFENILFSGTREFKILDHSLSVNHIKDNNNSIFGETRFYYKGFLYDAKHNMTLVRENLNWEIIYHCTTLKRLNEL